MYQGRGCLTLSPPRNRLLALIGPSAAPGYYFRYVSPGTNCAVLSNQQPGRAQCTPSELRDEARATLCICLSRFGSPTERSALDPKT
jgi:hypothetical protein